MITNGTQNLAGTASPRKTYLDLIAELRDFTLQRLTLLLSLLQVTLEALAVVLTSGDNVGAARVAERRVETLQTCDLLVVGRPANT